MNDYTVHGGAHGIDANLDDMDRAGSLIRRTGWAVGEEALSTQRYLVDSNLVRSAVFSPGTFATFESTLLDALNGSGGLSSNALRITAAGLVMQGAATRYQATDQAREFAEDLRQHGTGMLFGYTLPVSAPLAGIALWRDGAFADPEAWLVAHPDTLEEAIASSPGLVDLFQPGSGFPADTEQASGLLALLYGQGLGGTEVASPYADQAPGDLAEAMDRLDTVGAQTDQFRIERVGDSYNVYLPGTKALDAPWDESGVVQNMGTNFAAVAGSDNAYAAAIFEALEEAGVPHDAPINLMGHSQGGIVAMRVAETMSTSQQESLRYDVRSVVTAGSPVHHIELPESVQALSLVNEYDITPRLDGEDIRDASNHTSVVTALQTDSVTGNHSLAEVYLPLARALEQNRGDDATRDALAVLEPFLTGEAGESWDVRMSRP